MVTDNLFADLVRSLRKARGQRLHALAAITRLGIVELSEIERGKHKPSDDEVYRLADAFLLSRQVFIALFDELWPNENA